MAPALGLLAIYSINVYKDLKTGYKFTVAFFFFVPLRSAQRIHLCTCAANHCQVFGILLYNLTQENCYASFILYDLADTVQMFELLSYVSMKLLQ